MKFGSLFAGIGGIDLGLERAGMECAWQVEIDKHCVESLEKHWPDVKRYEDVRNVGKGLETVDLICGGFPCQDLSVAGRRAGLDGERSGLWWEFARVIDELRPRWVVIENVPGLLSSDERRDMGLLLGKLAEFGYMGAYRVLDAQYFGVAQRRRRVFIIGHLTESTYPVQVLFEPESSERHSPPSREKGKIAPAIPASGAGTSRTGNSRTEAEMMVIQTAHTQANQNPIKKTHVSESLESGAMGQYIAFDASRAQSTGDVAAPLRVNGGRNPGVNDGKPDNMAIAYALNGKDGNRYDGESETFVPYQLSGSLHSALGTAAGDGNDERLAISNLGVRRLTPLECERLQGFPDGWTEGASDTQRYRMLGNAVAVPVIEWIGRRIMEVEQTPL